MAGSFVDNSQTKYVEKKELVNFLSGLAGQNLVWQPIKFCVNNNPSSNNGIADCGAIRLSDLPRVNFSFLSVECYARLA